MPADDFVRATGPECPKCGTNATRLTVVGSRGSYTWARFACENESCEHEFVLGDAPPVESGWINGIVRKPLLCPKCGSDNIVVHTTRRPPGFKLQYYKCRSCTANFKVYEPNASPSP